METALGGRRSDKTLATLGTPRARAWVPRRRGMARARGASITAVLCLLVTSVAVALGPSAPSGAATALQAVPVASVSLASPGEVISPGLDVPDPFVTQVGGVYFMFSSESLFYGPNIPLMVSTSLTSWSGPALDAMPTLPAWAGPGFTWSPDVRELHGRYVMWFSASVASAGFGAIKCIGVATSASITGPFVSKAPEPTICQLDHLGSIDPRTFLDPQGRLWLLWKSDDNAAVNGDTHSTIFIQRLSSNGLRLLGEPISLMTADVPWEGRIVESPDMVFAGGHYWLFFSGNWFNQPDYGVGVAQCAGPAGPCTSAAAGPWLGSNAQGDGPGEESLFYDGSRWWMFYAPYALTYQTWRPRPAAILRLTFGADGPVVVAPGTSAWTAPEPEPRINLVSAEKVVKRCPGRVVSGTCVRSVPAGGR